MSKFDLMNMIEALEEIEKELPDLLDLEGWESLNVDYFPPVVHRVWRQYGDYRICLHRIFPPKEDDKVLFHPHKWPCAVKLLKGQYETTMAYKWDRELPPLIAGKLVLNEGSVYEMNRPHQWHSVRPVNCEYALSLLVMGPLYNVNYEGAEVKKKLKPLSNRRKNSIIKEFKEIYYYDEV